MTRTTEEYRRETADYVISIERPITHVAKELGINKKTFSAWGANVKTTR